MEFSGLAVVVPEECRNEHHAIESLDRHSKPLAEESNKSLELVIFEQSVLKKAPKETSGESEEFGIFSSFLSSIVVLDDVGSLHNIGPSAGRTDEVKVESVPSSFRLLLSLQ